MPKLREPRTRLAVVLLAVALCASGCGTVRDIVVVEKPREKVVLKGYELSLAYGDPPPEDATLAPVPQPTPLADLVTVMFDLEPEVEYIAPRRGSPPPAAPADPCPPPEPNTVAERAITGDIASVVEAGVYLWQQSGQLEIVGIGKVPLPTLTTRIVRNVVTQGGITTFDVELFNGLRRQVQSFRVVPNDGLFVTKIVTKVADQTRTFSPIVPVEILPLPVVELTTVRGAGLDPLTGETLVVSGTVTKKDRIEGCKELVDGWLVEATWTFQRGADSQVWDYDYTVATQHGGFIVGDHLKTTERFGTLQATVDITSRFGSIHPKPEAPA